MMGHTTYYSDKKNMSKRSERFVLSANVYPPELASKKVEICVGICRRRTVGAEL